MRRVIYLTGAPATGKSTICKNIYVNSSEVEIYSYGSLLREVVSERTRRTLTEHDMRELSAALVTSEDVQRTDDLLMEKVQTARISKHIIIDSHAVTKEVYGFRVTPFKIDQLKALNPDLIICTYASPDVVASRIQANANGRPLPHGFELDMHIKLQASLAAQYGFFLNCPCYIVDTSGPIETVLQHFQNIAKI